MLTPSELNNYSGDTGKTTVRRILADVKEVCGFDAGGGRLFVQYYPSREGGCELFVTRLRAFGEATYASGTAEPADFRADGEKREGEAGMTENQRCQGAEIYSFGELRDMLAFCGRLKRVSRVRSNVSAFKAADGVCYLVFGSGLSAAALLSAEYNGVRLNKSAALYIDERCSLVCAEDAVNILGDFS